MTQQPRPFDLKCESGGLTFLVDKIGRQAGPLQKLRELVQNSIEARATRIDIGPDPDIDVNSGDRGEPGMVQKLSFTDDGCGMTADELEHHTLSIALSGKTQGDDLNYGIGGRVSTLVFSPFGVEYTAWKGGQGNRIRLTKKKDKSGEARYCAEEFDGERLLPISDPPPFADKDSGFRVTLLGTGVADLTLLPPDGQKNHTYWIHRYLNQRYFVFPEGLAIRACSLPKDAEGKIKFEQVQGLRDTILPFCDAHGVIDLEFENPDQVPVKAHWFLLKEPKTENVQKGWVNRWGGGGQFGVLHKNELYHVRDRGEGNSDLKRCGIILGCKRVVILMEPDAAAISVDLDRSRLRYKNSTELDLGEMQVAFARKMPKELREYQDSLYQPSDREDEQRQMRKLLEEAFQHMPRSWKADPDDNGDQRFDPDSEAGSASTRRGARSGGTSRSSPTSSSGDSSGDGLSGKRARNIDPTRANRGDRQPSDHIPRWEWIAPDSPDDALWGCAAQYQRGTRFVQFNPKYIGYERMLASVEEEYAGQAAHHKKEIEDAVRFFYMMPIIQAIVGIEMELSARNWDIDQAIPALEPRALTGVSYAVGGFRQAIRRRLSAALGRKRAEEGVA